MEVSYALIKKIDNIIYHNKDANFMKNKNHLIAGIGIEQLANTLNISDRNKKIERKRLKGRGG